MASCLGFDLSSKASAYAYSVDGAVIKYGKWVNKNYDKGFEDHGKSLLKFSGWVSRSIRGCPSAPDVVVIEAPFYNRNIRTYGVLCKFLGAAEREIRRILPDVEIQMVQAAAVKKAIGVEVGKSHAERKQNMVKRVNRLFGLDLKYHKSNKLISQDDIADAIAVTTYYFKSKQ